MPHRLLLFQNNCVVRHVFVSCSKLLRSKSAEVELEEKRKAGRIIARKKELTMDGEEERKGRGKR